MVTGFLSSKERFFPAPPGTLFRFRRPLKRRLLNVGISDECKEMMDSITANVIRRNAEWPCDLNVWTDALLMAQTINVTGYMPIPLRELHNAI